MDHGARQWLVKTAYKHLWRVHSFYELDDLIQDGHMLYALVRQRYPRAKDAPHIMRLFTVTFINHIHDLSKHQSRMAALIDASTDLETVELYQDPGSAEQGDTYFIPNKAPWYIHAFLRVLCDPQGQMQLRSQYRVRLSGVRELTHDRLCRLIGADPSTTPTMPDALERYFAQV
jgi:hypothetical protein